MFCNILRTKVLSEESFDSRYIAGMYNAYLQYTENHKIKEWTVERNAMLGRCSGCSKEIVKHSSSNEHESRHMFVLSNCITEACVGLITLKKVYKLIPKQNLLTIISFCNATLSGLIFSQRTRRNPIQSFPSLSFTFSGTYQGNRVE